MDRHYDQREMLHAAQGPSYAGNACGVTDTKASPVPLALGQLEEAVDQLIKARDYLEARLDSALSPPAPEKDTTSPERSQAPSALAERIQQTVDRVGYVTRRLSALASRVTL